MDKAGLIECFGDTLKQSMEGKLKRRTKAAQKSNRVYKEGFTAKRHKNRKIKADIIVERNTSYAAASKYLEYGKTAVLNFANPVNPGGGVEYGAMAQEECLCRSSNLFQCISDDSVKAGFYNYHTQNRNNMNSDRLIYTKGVTVFKSDAYIPVMLDKKSWFSVDVITCAAPYLGEIEWIDGNVLSNIIKNRIKNIFEAALENRAAVLILGAFGCGAFYNPPELVARAFHEVIIEGHYRNYFSKIVFAIKADDNKGARNYEVFDKELGSCRNLKAFAGKSISVFGDSISTLEGYNPDGYDVFYTRAMAPRYGINSPSDTWWGMVIDYLGGKLMVNNSWSGCKVSQTKQEAIRGSAGCSSARTKNLHDKSGTPDCIIIYMGFNDWGSGVYAGDTDGHKTVLNEAEFSDAYTLMLRRIKTNYPAAEIYCCTLCKTCMEEDSSFIFLESFGGVHIEEYNRAIKRACADESCKLLDLYSYNIPYDSIDGTHPTKDGMKTLAGLVARRIIS